MTKKTKYYILLGVNIFLVLALSIAVFGFVKRNNDYKDAKTEIKHKQTTIEQQTKTNKELEEKLKQSEDNKASIQAELDTTKQENESLESENAKLKTEITQLKAKKASAVSSANKPAVPQNPQPTGKVCYLTFDDGPSANTLKILEILNRYNVKATFFVVDNAQTKIEYVPQIHAAGHTIGLHTASHNYAKIYSSVDNYFADLNAISSKVNSLIGLDSKVLRFPGGSSNTTSRKYCQGIMSVIAPKVTEMGYTYFDWNVDSGDASGHLSSSKIASNVLQQARNKTSICVLMHDAVGKVTTVDALSAIIEGLINQGFYFAPLTTESHGYHHGIQN
ncbi:MAG: polysaccharide deacetylase family protein [Clostridia bacterium]|nr:polysaccharide deacetylase family protein [Clostridia bacterium]